MSRPRQIGRDGEPFVEDDYYESFLNVDIGGRFVYWNGKDPDYRVAILRALSAAQPIVRADASGAACEPPDL